MEPLVGIPDPVGGAGPALERRRADRAGPSDGADFRQFLLDNLNKVNDLQLQSDRAIQDLATGDEQDITRVMTAVEKANVAFQTLMAVRNKIIDSYDAIMQMRV